ncbi:hypothetical protein H4R34_001736 [Dimargaris verticillata]|uniref:Mitochondrial potassium channel ATP-binding subunit n=1 Tax=Dimargaris verticillata TaxID=2761393 RepID=A0A9W8EAN2_9FUNG|nr:hypothetical protein H4R34_001736 [Dimargaris verticillata]
MLCYAYRETQSPANLDLLRVVALELGEQECLGTLHGRGFNFLETTWKFSLFLYYFSLYNPGRSVSRLGYHLLVAGACVGLPLYYHARPSWALACDASESDASTFKSSHHERMRILQLESHRRREQQKRDIDQTSNALSSKQVQGSWMAIWRLVKPDTWLLVAVVFAAVGSAVVNLWTPIVMGDLINILSRSLQAVTTTTAAAMSQSITPAVIRQGLHQAAMKLLALFAAQGVFTAGHIYLVSALGERVAFRLHDQLFTALVTQDIAFFDMHRTGELAERLSADIGDFKHTFKQVVTQGLKATTLTVGSIGHLLYVSTALTTVMAGTMPLIYLALFGYGRFLRSLRHTSRVWEGLASGIGLEALGNIRTVRAFSAESAERALYLDACARTAQFNGLFGAHMGAFRGLTNFSIGTMVLLVLYYGGYLVTRGDLAPGQLMAYMVSIQNAQRALDTLGGLMGQSIRALSSFNRVQEYLAVAPLVPISGGKRVTDVRGELEFANVSFTYPSRPNQPVLEGFSLQIPAGQVVAVCGGSGSGKSTLAVLLERFYDPDAGSIYVDGIPLTRLDPRSVREHVGYINQEPILFATSLAENIRYGNPQATMEEIRRAAHEANAAEFIESFPDSYNTVVGERGVTLSGGQKQRIAIARAILKRPKILILDEATSALDNESEKLVQAALDRLMQGRTVLVIAHRLSTIQHADKIVVMGKVPGHIMETGTHDELLARRGHYYRLYTQSNS